MLNMFKLWANHSIKMVNAWDVNNLVLFSVLLFCSHFLHILFSLVINQLLLDVSCEQLFSLFYNPRSILCTSSIHISDHIFNFHYHYKWLS